MLGFNGQAHVTQPAPEWGIVMKKVATSLMITSFGSLILERCHGFLPFFPCICKHVFSLTGLVTRIYVQELGRGNSRVFIEKNKGLKSYFIASPPSKHKYIREPDVVAQMFESSKKPHSIVHSLTCLHTLNTLKQFAAVHTYIMWWDLKTLSTFVCSVLHFTNESGIYMNDIAYIMWWSCGKKFIVNIFCDWIKRLC